MDWQALGHKIIQRPIYQAAGVLALIVVFTGLNFLLDVSGILKSDDNTPWVISLAMILFYAAFNSIFSLKTESILRYFSRSIFCYIGLLITGFGFAYLATSLSIDEAGSFRWLIVVLTFGYLIFLVIVRLIKRIVEIATKQDSRFRGDD